MAKKVEDTKDLATTQTKAIAQFDYGDDAVPVGQVGKGFEGQTNADVSIPFIRLLQPGSPQVAGQTIDGVQAGMYLHSVSQKLWTNKTGGMLWVFSFTRHEYIQWRPIDHGGGFVARFEPEDPVVLKAKEKAKFGEYFIDNEGRTGKDGDELSETFTTFGVALDEEEQLLGMACLPFKSSGIKTYRNCMTQLRAHTSLGPTGKMQTPLYAHVNRFTSEFKQKDKNSWWEPRWEPKNKTLDASLLAPTDERFLLAKSIKKMIESGQAKVDYSKMEGGGERKGEDIPF